MTSFFNPSEQTPQTPPDITTTITTNLSQFTLLSSPVQPQTPIPKFTLYPLLPTELRLKILSHTLPPPSVLKLKTHLLLSDPSFGLYLTFTPAHKTRPSSLFSPQKKNREDEISKIRMLSLLSTSHEARSWYIDRFSIELPTDGLGVGRIRVDKREVVYLSNFDELVKQKAFIKAIDLDIQYRLQPCLGEIENLALSAALFRRKRAYHFLRMFGGVKVVKAIIWDGFWGLEDERVREGVWRSMEEGVGGVKRELGEFMGEGWRGPRLVLQGAEERELFGRWEGI